MKEKLERFESAITWILLLITAIVSVTLAYELFGGGANTAASGAVNLPKAVECPDGAEAPPARAELRAERADVFFSTEGCNALDPGVATETFKTIAEYEGRLKGTGLPGVESPTAVRAVVQPINGVPYRTFPDPGFKGAMEIGIDLENPSAQEWRTVAGLAELSVANFAPGIDPAGRRTLGRAYAMLLSEGTVDNVSQLLRAGNDGLFETWIASVYGVGILLEAMERCKAKSCVWDEALDEELSQRGLSPSALRSRGPGG